MCLRIQFCSVGYAQFCAKKTKSLHSNLLTLAHTQLWKLHLNIQKLAPRTPIAIALLSNSRKEGHAVSFPFCLTSF